MQKKALVIVNGHTAKQRLKMEFLNVLDVITKNGFLTVVRPTQKREDATAYTAINARCADLIVCIGGDGTLKEVITGLSMLDEAERPPLAYIPAGTTNDFASSLGIPMTPTEAAKAIFKGSIRKMDCGMINGKLFNYTASFGAFTAASYATPQEMKNAIGHAAYLIEGFINPDIKPHHIKFTANGKSIEGNFAYGGFSNTLSLAGVLKLAGDVKFNDGFHEYMLVRMPDNIAEFNEIVRQLTSGDYRNLHGGEPLVYYGKFREAFIECEKMSWSLDGEEAKFKGSIRISNIHSAYEIIC